jgi:hypothetical protein
LRDANSTAPCRATSLPTPAHPSNTEALPQPATAANHSCWPRNHQRPTPMANDMMPGSRARSSCVQQHHDATQAQLRPAAPLGQAQSSNAGCCCQVKQPQESQDSLWLAKAFQITEGQHGVALLPLLSSCDHHQPSAAVRVAGGVA